MHLYFIFFALWAFYFQNCYGEDAPTGKNNTPQYLDELLSSKKYDEFAKIMKISNVALVDASQRKSSVDEMFYYSGTDLGDIYLRPEQLLNPDQLNYFDGIINITIQKWDNGIVPYYLSKEYAENETQFIENELKHNNELYAPYIHIRPYQDGDTDYVMFFKGGCGCYTNLGKVGGPQAISMSTPCIFDGSPSHEMTHVLGIPHASNRLDRDDYIPLITEHIPESMKSQYSRYSAENPANIGHFDYNSIVFYPSRTPGFGLTSYNITDERFRHGHVGYNQVVSPGDIKRVKRFYRKK